MGESNKHALKSPSKAGKHMACVGSLAMELASGVEDTGSDAAKEGTAAHWLAEKCLHGNKPANTYVGEEICFWVHPESESSGVSFVSEFGDNPDADGVEFLYLVAVDEEFAGYVQDYLDVVWQHVGDDGELFVETKVPIGHITGEEGATGTADAVILRPHTDGYELVVIDLKFGQGFKHDAGHSEQLCIYACGALAKFDLEYDIQHVRLVISQPRVFKEPSVRDCSVQALLDFFRYAKERYKKVDAAVETYKEWAGTDAQDKYLSPGSHCSDYFCKAAGPACPAMTRMVSDTILGDFQVLANPEEPPKHKWDWAPDDPYLLASYFLKLPIIEHWCKKVAEKANAEAHQGNLREEHGLKLVAGKKGNREWANAEEAEAALKAMRLKQEEMYNFKLISPTQAEKLAPKFGKDGKPKPDQGETPIGPRQWPKIAAMIVQREGKPTLVHVSDGRPALKIGKPEDDFDVLAVAAAPAPVSDIDDLL